MKQQELGGLKTVVTGEGNGPVVVLMHGFGAPGDDLVSLHRVIAAPAGTRFVFPEAPIALGGPFGGGRAWWSIDMMQLQRDVMSGNLAAMVDRVPEQLDVSRALVNALLDDIGTKLGTPRSRIVLGGFSQGSMLAMDVALRAEKPLAGVVLLSSTLIAAKEWRPLMPSRKGLPVFQSHGQEDPVLPFEIAEMLRDELIAAKLDVTWIPFRGGHGIPPQVIDGLGPFLQKAFEKS